MKRLIKQIYLESFSFFLLEMGSKKCKEIWNPVLGLSTTSFENSFNSKCLLRFKRKVSALERGWTGGKPLGKKFGAPQAVNKEHRKSSHLAEAFFSWLINELEVKYIKTSSRFVTHTVFMKQSFNRTL